MIEFKWMVVILTVVVRYSDGKTEKINALLR